MAKRLVVLSGPDEGRAFTIPPADAMLFGRSRATETKLIDPHVSRVHCQVQLDGDRPVVTDFDSAGGTFVNGKRVARHVLQPGDIVRLGNTRLQYIDERAETAAPSAQKKVAAPTAARPALWLNQLPGERFGHFKVGSLLARGQTGYVFHATDIRRKNPVALKVIDPAFGKDDAAVRRFVKAMKTALRLRHPNLVTVYAAGKTGPYCWVATEYVAGESLSAIIGRAEVAGPLDWRQVLPLGISIARALDYAHRKHVVHRNVNPQNILIGTNPKDTKLADLMLATALEGEVARKIRQGELTGALPYMAPERTASGPVDARCDVYSLGATMYAMLVGRPPFTGDSLEEVVRKIRQESPTPLRALQPKVPEPLEGLVLRLLAKRPQERPQSAAELVKALAGYAQAQGVTV
jgi:serine/threonine protein kinase